MNQLATVERVCTATGRKQCFVFVLSFLKTYHDIFWGYFVASVSSGPHQAWFSRPISCQLTTFLNDRLVARARPAALIEYQIQVLEVIGAGVNKATQSFFLFLVLKNDQATRLFFYSKTKVERKWCTNSIMHGRG